MEQAAGSPYPNLIDAVRERETNFKRLIERPELAQKLAKGELAIVRLRHDLEAATLEPIDQ